jgi:putative flavoprotein involved in K+ transport
MGRPVLEDGRVLEVATVVWATGFVRDSFSQWVKLPIFDALGEPIHHRGVVLGEPGLYFVGLPFQSSLLSGIVAGAGPDARHVVGQLMRRARAAQSASSGNHRVWRPTFRDPLAGLNVWVRSHVK